MQGQSLAGAKPAPPPSLLVTEWDRPTLKFMGRTPTTLHELQTAKAVRAHHQRLAEIKAIAVKLALLDRFLPALAERGVTLASREITATDSGKTLLVQSFAFIKDDKLRAALIDLGFKEIERTSIFTGEDRVTLKHGRSLAIAMYVNKAPAPAAITETAGCAA